jgi:hypothetical protein
MPRPTASMPLFSHEVQKLKADCQCYQPKGCILDGELETIKMRFEGVILPAKFDINGNPIKIFIQTNGENKYSIDNSGSGKELLNLICSRVIITGNLRKSLDGRATVLVKSYKVIEYSDVNNPSPL